MSSPAPSSRTHRGLYLLLGLHLLFFALYFTPRLREDAPYYYEHLRSAWFDQDLNFYNERPYTRPPLRGKIKQFVAGPNERQRPAVGGPNNTFDVGTTVLEIPFFLAGDAGAHLARALGRPVGVHGYGKPYVLSMSIGFLAIGLLGALLCYDTAARFTDPKSALMATGFAVWGSFMPAYFYEDTLLSHLPSFVSAALFLWTVTLAQRRIDLLLLWAVGASFAWLCMTRRQNALLGPVVLVLVPKLLALPYRRALAGIGAGLAGFGVTLLPELLLWRIEHGSLFANPGMVPFRSRPVLGLVLLSDHGGLFSQSPVLLAGAVGLLILLLRHRLWGALLLVGVGLQILVNALRVEWWPGIGFGNRRSDSIVPIFVLGLAVLLSRLPVRPRRLLLAGLTLLLIWNMAALPQFYAGDRVGAKGEHFEAFAAHRTPDQARYRLPFPPPTAVPPLLSESANIVAANSYVLRGSPLAMATLAAVAAASLLALLGFRLLRPTHGRALAIAIPLLFSLPASAYLLYLPTLDREVLALYYDPREPPEILRVGPGPFTGGVDAMHLDPDGSRTLPIDPEATVEAVEIVLDPAAPICGWIELADQRIELPGTATVTEVPFPRGGHHLRLDLPRPTRAREIRISSCNGSPLQVLGLALPWTESRP